MRGMTLKMAQTSGFRSAWVFKEYPQTALYLSLTAASGFPWSKLAQNGSFGAQVYNGFVKMDLTGAVELSEEPYHEVMCDLHHGLPILFIRYQPSFYCQTLHR